jgi:hypothetical protein
MLAITDLWTVGPEDDESLLERLGDSLQSLGYELDGSWNGIARSREVFHWEVSRAWSTLVVESETGRGLTVSGSPSDLLALKTHFNSNAAEYREAVTALALTHGGRLPPDLDDH